MDAGIARMRDNNAAETIIGAVVVAVAALFMVFAYMRTGSGSLSGYEILARLPRVDGLGIGTDVRLSGIKVGTVAKMALDPKSYNAVVTIALDNSVKLPDDSSVRVTSEGLLGNQFLSIEAGASMQMIKPGGEIENTQGSIDLIGLLGKAVFSAGGTK